MTGTRQLDSLTLAEIKQAVAELMPGHGWAETYMLLGEVAEHLGSSQHNYPAGYTGRVVARRYSGRVKRAMDKLAGEGVLVKAGKDDPKPDGTNNNSVYYYTREAWDAAAARGRQRLAEAEVLEARWERVQARLGELEILMPRRGRLTIDAWEQLLDKMVPEQGSVVIDWLSAHPRVSAAEVAAGVGMLPGAALSHLKIAEVEGAVRRLPHETGDGPVLWEVVS